MRRRSDIARLFALLALLSPVACLMPTTSASLAAALAPAASMGTTVECDSGCTIPWQRAQVWVANHAPMKIQTATDVLLETYNVTSYEAKYTMTVTKTPLDTPGRYSISIGLSCANMFGCSPKESDVRLAFLYYVATGKDVLIGQPLGGGIR
jgi:hypothetical protein